MYIACNMLFCCRRWFFRASAVHRPHECAFRGLFGSEREKREKKSAGKEVLYLDSMYLCGPIGKSRRENL